MSKYTKKVSGLEYSPTGECPAIEELTDMTKTKELVAEILQSDAPEDVKKFLIEAAHRHTIYNYGKIAEYYCHAPASIQTLMEKSALVVIDFEDALKYGFVKYSKKLEELRGAGNDRKDDGVLVLEKDSGSKKEDDGKAE